MTNLIDELSFVQVVTLENFRPEFETTTLDEVSSLVFVHLVLVGDVNELRVAESFGVGDVSEVRVASLAVLSDSERIVDLSHPTWIQYHHQKGRIEREVSSRCSP